MTQLGKRAPRDLGDKLEQLVLSIGIFGFAFALAFALVSAFS